MIPRLTNAHNFLNAQGIYRFLSLFQMQGVAGWLFWDWGPLKNAPFLPRVFSPAALEWRTRLKRAVDPDDVLGCGNG